MYLRFYYFLKYVKSEFLGVHNEGAIDINTEWLY